jgi:hypothetical protein
MFGMDVRAEIEATQERLLALCAALDPTDASLSDARWACAAGEHLRRVGQAIATRFAATTVDPDECKRLRYRTPADWYAAVHGTTTAAARRELELSAQLPDLPVLAAAMFNGEVPTSLAAPIGVAASANPDEEPRLVTLARTGTPAEVRSACEQVRAHADKDPDATRERARKERSYRCWFEHGRGHIRLTGPADEITRINNKILDGAGRRYRATRTLPADEREPIEAHRYDTAIDVLLADSDGTPVPAGADAKIIIRADLLALLRGHALPGELCDIAGVGPVPVSIVRSWFNEAFIAAVLTDGTEVTNVVHLGRKFTAHQLTALQFRDPECVTRGCTNTISLELDHDTGWAHTHTTETRDAQRLCPTCHRKKTLGWHLHPPDEHGKRELVPPHHPTHPDQELRQALLDAGEQIHAELHGAA